MSAEQAELVQDLLPSPTAERPTSSTSPASRQRPITTDDLQHRSCWICADSEDDEETNTDAGAQRRKRKFVHPCRCTLVAHQSCLLHWIAQARQNKPGEPVKCPQCQSEYIILENRPALLKFLDWADRQVGKAVSVNVWVLLSTATLLSATAYGCIAIRLVLGKEAAARTLASPWPLRYYIQIPLVPLALIASRLHFMRVFDPLTPWMVAALPTMTHLPLLLGSLHGLMVHRRLSAGGRSTTLSTASTSQRQRSAVRVWPPNPGPTFMLMPFIRFAYLYLRLRISRHFLQPLLDPRSASRRRAESRRNQRRQQRQPERHEQQQPARTQRVVILGAEGVEARLLDADPPPGAAAVVESDRDPTAEEARELFGDDESEHEDYIDPQSDGSDADDNFAEFPTARRGGVVHQQTVYITRQSVGRLILSALTLPFAAAGMGSLLASVTRLTGKGSWLRKFMGLHFEELDTESSWKSPVKLMQELFGGSTSSDGTSKSHTSGTPVASLFYSNNRSDPSTTAARSGRSVYEDALQADYYPITSTSAWFANMAGGRGPSIYDDLLDAPWWRNALGGLLFIALQDAFKMTYRYLKLKQRGRVFVRDLPFEQHLLDSLDIRPGRRNVL
ncbi:hypothetical protein OC861_006392 [Tilletia horrida]|nr:hypothetical protein OC845_006290 [Tilletia horrida]KAK0560142.1 hypothetical protein OC861_006392 [Tilletia horrida]